MSNNIDTELDKALSKYQIDYPLGIKCRCREGAPGHIRQDLRKLIDRKVKEASKDQLEAVQELTHQGRGTILWEVDSIYEHTKKRISQLQQDKEAYKHRTSDGKYSFSVDRPCVCGHGLDTHTAEKPRACGKYGTGLNDCPCENYKPLQQDKGGDET